MMSPVALIRSSITAKVCFFICVTETALLCVLGVILYRGYVAEIEHSLAEKLALPAALMSRFAMNFEAAAEIPALEAIVQERVVEAFVARTDGTVFYASAPGRIGGTAVELSPPTGAGGALRRMTEAGRERFALASPLVVDGAVVGHFFVKIDAAGVVRQERALAGLLIVGAALTVLLTGLIAAFWMHRLLAPRLVRTIAALQQVGEGRLSTRLSDAGAPDQIGRLMHSVDAMIAQVEAQTRNLQTLAEAGREFANAESRSELQRMLLHVLAARFAVTQVRTCRLMQDEAGTVDARCGCCTGLTPAQHRALARGELLLAGAGDCAGAPESAAAAAAAAHIVIPLLDPPGAAGANCLDIGAGSAGGEGSASFLRTLGRLLADAAGRLEAIARLRRAEKEYREIFSSAVEGIFRLSPSGRLEAANPSFAGILGFTAAADPGIPFQEFLRGRPDFLEGWSDFLERVGHEGEIHDVELGFTRDDGSPAWIALSARVKADERGQPAGIDGGAVDITERKRREAADAQRAAAETEHRAKAEVLATIEEKNRLLEHTLAELRRTQAKLVQTEKMAAMGTMAAGVAHDLNNILSGIIGYPDLLLLDVPEPGPLREGLTVVKASGERAAAVVADLLTIARGSAYPTAPCDLNRLVTLYLHSPECRQLLLRFPGVRVRPRLAEDARSTHGSAVHLQKVVMNLVMNACEAIRGAGEVVVSTGNAALGPDDALAQSIPPGDYVFLKVADTGPGIAERDLAHIFEPFFSKKVLGRSGTGLGLAVVWNTVAEHRGTVIAESGDNGAVFSVFLPTTEAEPAAGRQTDLRPEELKGTASILVVDDEPLLRQIATKSLSALGYRVEAVCSGEEAIARLKTQPFDLIVLDMLMPPGMNGCETYREIVKIRPGQKALICSGFSLNEDYYEAQRLGAGAFLKKPYTLEELGRAVKRELELAAGERTAPA